MHYRKNVLCHVSSLSRDKLSVIDSESLLEALDLFTCGLVGENMKGGR